MKQDGAKFDPKTFKGKPYWSFTETMRRSPWGLADCLILSEITQNTSWGPARTMAFRLSCSSESHGGTSAAGDAPGVVGRVLIELD